MLQLSTGIFLTLLFVFAQCYPPPDVSTHPNLKFFANLTCGELASLKPGVRDYPWSALLTNSSDQFYCQGSIIHDRYILTAANCVENARNLKQVRVGEYNLDKFTDCLDWICEDENVQDLEIESIHIHPKYSPITRDNDLALLRLKNDIIFKPQIAQPVCLPFQKEKLNYPEAEVHGWGLTSDPSFTTVQKMFVKVIDNDLCADHFIERLYLSHKKMCTLVKTSNKHNWCIEDNGAPIADDRFKFVQVGVASFANSCSSKKPNIYTKLVYYMEWLLDTMKE